MDQNVKGGRKVGLRSFSRSLPMSLMRAREAVMSRFRASLRLFNITEQQWRVLRALTAVETIEVTELAEATCLLAPSLSRILKDMEDRGLIRRDRIPEDLRRALVSITPKGMRLIDAVAPYSEAAYAQISQTFGDEKMECLQTLLKELADRLGELPPVTCEPGELDIQIAQLAGGSPRGRPRNDEGA